MIGDVGSKTIYEGACSCRNCLTFLEAGNERFLPRLFVDCIKVGMPCHGQARQRRINL
jgi:hypothetical protein